MGVAYSLSNIIMRHKGGPRSLFLGPLVRQDLIDGRLQVIVTNPPWYSSQLGETHEVTFKQCLGAGQKQNRGSSQPGADSQMHLGFLPAQPHVGLAEIEGAFIGGLTGLRHVGLRNLAF